MSYINIKIDKIIKNISYYKADNIVCKSNFYGFGYETLKHVKEYIGKVTVANAYEYKLCSKYLGNEVEFVILYSNFEHEISSLLKQDNVYFCINNFEQLNYIEENSLNKSRFYLRIDEMLGLHGFQLKDIELRDDLYEYMGIIVHINEFISVSEKDVICKIESLAEKNKLLFSLGGSNAYSYLSNKPRIEYRYTARLFESSTSSLFQLNLNVLNIVHLDGNSLEIGYKSDRKIICDGTLLLVDIGYGDWTLLSRIYQNDIKLHFENYELEIPVYPCMNTAWLYCKDILSKRNEICLFRNVTEIETLCLDLDIDKDELYTSFHENIKRVYEL